MSPKKATSKTKDQAVDMSTIGSDPTPENTLPEGPDLTPEDDSEIVVPDDASSINLQVWNATAYGPIHGSSADKLSDSAVAPLVAVARGYRTLTSDSVRDVLTPLGKTAASAEGKQLKRAIGDRDALLMPWYRPADVVEMQTKGYEVAPSSLQVRPHPSNVLPGPDGKKRKYENLYGQSLVLDMHPATPKSQITSPYKRMLVTEGLIKADSALTAYLLGNGISRSELELTDADSDVTAARARLTALMETIPEGQRAAIIGIIGVGTWRQNPEWNSINIKDGVALVAFDGDVATKPQVWKQAKDIFEYFEKNKHASPYLIDLSGVDLGNGEKVGIDDYFAGVEDATWGRLLGMSTSELPPKPLGADQDDNATVRMNPKNFWMEEKTPGDPENGIPSGWVPKVPLIGRIVSIENRRSVTDEEQATGVYQQTVSAREVDSNCTIEIQWKDPSGEVYTSIVEGPSVMLASSPDAWTRPTVGAAIHADVLSLPAWPPRNQGWLEAMKAARRDEIVQNASWSHMGWVPRPDGGAPVYLVGKQVISAIGFDSDTSAVCGIDERELVGVSKFGVDVPDSDNEARDAIKTMLATYSRCWSDPRHFAVVVAAGLRPVVPLQTHASVMFSGISGAGKALPLDTMVPTPTGVVAVCDIKVGDEIFAGDGSVTTVRGLSPIFDDERIFEVTLSDGQKVLMSGNHTVSVSTTVSRRLNGNAVPKRSQRAAAIRRLADNLSGGDSNTLMEIAKAIGFSYSHVAHTVKEAGVPFMEARVVNTKISAVAKERQKIAGYVIEREPLAPPTTEVKKSSTRLVNLYPVSEVLYAVADKIDCDSKPLMVSHRLSELVDDFRTAGYGLPMFPGFEGEEVELPIGPYTLGAWLGDGTSIRGDITGVDDEVLDNIRAEGYTVEKIPSAKHGYSIREIGRKALVENDLYGNKHIPMEYLRSSRQQRMALLRGLMDTDGTVDSRGRSEISLSDERLSSDVLELIRGLGIKASVTVNSSGYRDSSGEVVPCKDRHRIKFTTSEPVFGLTRKAERLPVETRNTSEWLYISDITEVEGRQSRCLQVDHPTGRFAHDGYVVTHNSFSSAAVMGFWQAYPGAWTDKSLTGSPKDTAAATEAAVSQTPIWIMDDLAPSASDPKAQAEAQARVNGLIRNIHNGAAKRRRTSEMGAAKVYTPRALLIVSAEAAPLNEQSIMNRLVHIEVQRGFLVKDRKPTDSLEELNKETTTVSKVTGYALNLIAKDIADRGWRRVYGEWHTTSKEFSADTAKVIQRLTLAKGTDSTKRQSETISEILLGLEVLRNVISTLGMNDDVVEGITGKDGEALLNDEGDPMTYYDLGQKMYDDIQAVAVEGFNENRRRDAGRTFLQRLANLLMSKQAHIEAAGTSGAPVVIDDHTDPETANFENQRLGWTLPDVKDQPARPMGPSIGYLVYDETQDDKPVILFNRESAFWATQRAYGRDGHNPKSLWDAVWSSELTHNGKWSRRKYGDKLGNTVRATVRGNSIEGIPIALDVLFDTGSDDEGEE